MIFIIINHNVSRSSRSCCRTSSCCCRTGFSPIEEARFFYNALEIKDFSNIGKYNKESIEIQKLAKDLPASPSTITKRLYLLALPEQVQNMLEAKDIGLLVVEQISRLRRLDIHH